MPTKRRVKKHYDRKTGFMEKAGFAMSLLNPKNFIAYAKTPHGRKRILQVFGGFFLVFALFIAYFAKDLPSPNKVNAILGAQTTKFYDRTGQTVLYEVFGDKNRTVVGLDKIDDEIEQATIAIEDRNFYKHGAFSSIGIIRAAFVNVFCKTCGTQGGSTITQQYVKNALLTSERTFSRKIRELMLSIMIEQFYKKEHILQLYLNEIPYGNQAYGVQTASQTYFSKDAVDVTLREAAILAAIPRAPTYYSPYGAHREDLVSRQNLILDKMVEQGYASKEDADVARLKTVEELKASVNPTPKVFAGIKAPHFVLTVQEQLEEKYGSKTVTEGGWEIITTLDLDVYNASQEAINKQMASVRRLGGSNAAMVVADPASGEVWSLIGSYDFGDPNFGAFNVATADRQPGSSFKPLVYSLAWGRDYNYGPGSTLYDVSTDFGGGYKPENYTDQTYGVMSHRTSIAGSLNIPAVKALYLVGVDKALQHAHKLGISTLRAGADQYGLALVLGAGEVKLADMVNAYSPFANEGKHYGQVYVREIKDSKKKIIEDNTKPKEPEQVLDPQVAYLMSHVLSDRPAGAYIFGNILSIPGKTVAVKTGTTENFRDAWTIGYTPGIVAGVWAGNNDNRPMTRSAGAIAAPIWKEFMANILNKRPELARAFTRPQGIKEVTLDANTGKLAAPGAKGPTRTDIFASWYKPPTPADGESAVIDKISGKRATDCTPPLARETVFASAMVAEIPPSDPAFGRWQPPVAALAAKLGYSGGTLPSGNDDVHSCSDTKPTVQLTVSHKGGGVYEVKSVVDSGTFTANKLEIFLDDQIISTQTINGDTTYTFNHPVTSNGTHFFKAVVTDSGLYTGEDTETETVTQAGGFAAVSPQGDVSGTSFTFSWTQRSGAACYQLVVDGVPRGTTSSTSLPSITVPPGNSHDWFVRAYTNAGCGGSPAATTPTVNFDNL